LGTAGSLALASATEAMNPHLNGMLETAGSVKTVSA
jgi:hypothetical protein